MLSSWLASLGLFCLLCWAKLMGSRSFPGAPASHNLPWRTDSPEPCSALPGLSAAPCKIRGHIAWSRPASRTVTSISLVAESEAPPLNPQLRCQMEWLGRTHRDQWGLLAHHPQLPRAPRAGTPPAQPKVLPGHGDPSAASDKAC